MMENYNLNLKDYQNRNIVLLGKIYQSFEALEKTLGELKLEEPLFMTYAAKKAFTQRVLKNPQRDEKFLMSRYKI